MSRTLTFTINAVIVLTYLWLLWAYGPPVRTPAPFYAITLSIFLGATLLLLVGLGHEWGLWLLDTYALPWPVDVARLLLAASGAYAVAWHLRGRRSHA